MDPLFLIVIWVLLIASPLMIAGVMYIYEKKIKWKKALKEGKVLVTILLKNGGNKDHIIKPDGEFVTIKDTKYELTQSGRRIDLRTMLYQWIFYEDDAVPIGTDPHDPLLNPTFLQKVILEEARAMGADEVTKYLKIILIAVAGLAGLLFFFQTGKI